MVDDLEADIPQAWEQIDLPASAGIWMVIGAPDAGKTTFAQYLARRLSRQKRERGLNSSVAFLDGDPGQTFLGPPTTMTLAIGGTGEQIFDVPAETYRYFVGSTSPRGHMLPVLVGAARLVQVAQERSVGSVIYDTSGLIDPSIGGLALKQAKIDLLQPAAVFAIQREHELEPLLVPLRRSRRTQVVTLAPSEAAIRRNPGSRRAHRAGQYRLFFIGARALDICWTNLAVFPAPRFSLRRLVALEDAKGFTLGLGIVLDIDRASRRVTLFTRIASLEQVHALRLGDVAVDPETFQDGLLS